MLNWLVAMVFSITIQWSDGFEATLTSHACADEDMQLFLEGMQFEEAVYGAARVNTGNTACYVMTLYPDGELAMVVVLEDTGKVHGKAYYRT